MLGLSSLPRAPAVLRALARPVLLRPEATALSHSHSFSSSSPSRSSSADPAAASPSSDPSNPLSSQPQREPKNRSQYSFAGPSKWKGSPATTPSPGGDEGGAAAGLPLPLTPPLPYRATRTPSGNLRVHQDTRSGGNRKITLVRKTEGDVRAMARDLAEGIECPEGFYKINPVTNAIEIKGHQKQRVVAWLTEKGF